MSKQDRQGVRTATQLEQKYGFGESFANVYKLISETQVDNERALAELDKSLTPEEIFNRLTGYQKYQGVFRGTDGNLYVNAEIIKGGKIESGILKVEAASITGLLEANQINAQDLKVLAANITGTLTAGQIDATNLKVSAANITGLISAGMIDVQTLISANGLIVEDDLDGFATESDLRNGRTTISGGCITTGTIDLNDVQLANNYGSLEMATGSNGSAGTTGAALFGPDYGIYLIVTNSACRMTAEDNNFYVSETRIHADIEIDVGSDERLKDTIEHDVAERYEEVYRKLQPARFKYRNGTSDRFHTGFIAQEVERAVSEGGLTNQDLAALVKGEDGMYAIRYAEMIALNTAMVQKLMDRVDVLEAEIKQLKGE